MTTDHTDKSVGLALAKTATIDEKQSIEAAQLNPQDYIPNSEDVTYHEFATLRHVVDHVPITAWLVVIVEFAER